MPEMSRLFRPFVAAITLGERQTDLWLAHASRPILLAVFLPCWTSCPTVCTPLIRSYRSTDRSLLAKAESRSPANSIPEYAGGENPGIRVCRSSPERDDSSK